MRYQIKWKAKYAVTCGFARDNKSNIYVITRSPTEYSVEITADDAIKASALADQLNSDIRQEINVFLQDGYSISHIQ